MANWFKIYETDLDETRLKYALDKIPDVGWVWIGILSECCKHRSDTIPWGTDEVELFGFSDRLKVSIPKVNESILMLCKIRYIELKDGFIKVLKWNDKQSDYCVRKDRGDYKKNPKYTRVSDNIGDSPREERRVEEKREDKKESPEAPIAPRSDPLEVPEKLKTREFMNAWAKWQTFRRQMKKVKDWVAMFRAQLEHLETFDAHTAAEMLNQSIRNGWTGLFELKNQQTLFTNGSHPNKPTKSIIEQDVDRLLRQVERDMTHD